MKSSYKILLLSLGLVLGIQNLTKAEIKVLPRTESLPDWDHRHDRRFRREERREERWNRRNEREWHREREEHREGHWHRDRY